MIHGQPQRRVSWAMRVLLAALLSLLMLATNVPSTPAHQASASPSPTPNQAGTQMVQKATTLVSLLAGGDYAGAARSFDASVHVTPSALGSAWKALTTQIGAFKRQISTNVSQTGAFLTVTVRCAFAKAEIDILVSFNSTQRVIGLHFVPSAPPAGTPMPSAPPPSYVNPSSFHEFAVQVGTKPWILPGTLSLPNGPGPFPAVVLVQGSGPGDRDETIGLNKPFRDLAWGLASQGIAVLRYDKRTLIYGGTLTAAKLAAMHFTVKQESIDDALAAVALLRQTRGINARRIFVLGHSLGGMLAPRIAKADPGIAGLIVLAGPTGPLEDAFLRQTIYLQSLGDATQANVDAVKKQVARVKALKPGDVSSSELLLGATPSYWLDLRAYHPAQTARDLPQPMLIMQGGRDYQVTQADYQGWKTALAARKDVVFKSYPALNHLFIAGSGQSTPMEYTKPGHVYAGVLSDIVSWVRAQGS